MLPPVSFTQQIDVPQLAFLLFAVFFAGLVWHLRQEDKREGYPLESERTERSGGRVVVIGWPRMPPPKVFLRKEGEPVLAPGPREERIVHARPAYSFPGAPLEPTGDPMQDGVGPASYALKEDVPDVTWSGEPKIQPLSLARDYALEHTEPDVIGMAVVDRHGVPVGTVHDVWADVTEYYVRFLEVATPGGGRRVMLPIAFAVIRRRKGRVMADSVSARQFNRAPAIARTDVITKREEDRLTAYFTAGYLYKDPPPKGIAA